MTVDEIIKLAGGPAKIAGESAGVIKADAVYKWPKIGIPDRHWPIIIRLAPDVTPQTLFDANLIARSEPHPIDEAARTAIEGEAA